MQKLEIMTLQRNEFLDERLNPDSLLPEVSLEIESVTELNDINVNYFNICNMEGVVIGSLEVDIPNNDYQTGYAEIRDIFLHGNDFDRSNPLKGYGKSTYLELIKYLGNVKLRSQAINDETTRIWDWLVEKGVAHKLLDQDTFETRI